MRFTRYRTHARRHHRCLPPPQHSPADVLTVFFLFFFYNIKLFFFWQRSPAPITDRRSSSTYSPSLEPPTSHDVLRFSSAAGRRGFGRILSRLIAAARVPVGCLSRFAVFCILFRGCLSRYTFRLLLFIIVSVHTSTSDRRGPARPGAVLFFFRLTRLIRVFYSFPATVISKWPYGLFDSRAFVPDYFDARKK